MEMRIGEKSFVPSVAVQLVPINLSLSQVIFNRGSFENEEMIVAVNAIYAIA